MAQAHQPTAGVAPLPPEDSATALPAARTGGPVGEGGGGPLLEGAEDRYDGIIVDPRSLPRQVAAFERSLAASLARWARLGKRGIWLKLPIEHAALVPAAVQAGFAYHSAEAGHLMLTRWLPESPSTLPPNASHQVGIGAFVLNDRGEVLAVQEKNGPLRGRGVWKFPTGLVQEAEDISSGAVREVKEETGIDTEFVEVIAFRQSHHVAFGKSDLFFVCSLRPLSEVITPQESEVEAAQWMPLEAFCEQAWVQNNKMQSKINELCQAHAKGLYQGLRAEDLPSNYFPRPARLYSNRTQDQAAPRI